MMLRTLIGIGVAALLVAACSASGGAASSGAATAGAPDPSVASLAPTAEPGAGGEASLPADITGPIVADAATRLGVDPSAVTVMDAHAETWPDGSLGCPEPGMMYTQALVDGYQVVVEANGTQLDYRGGAVGQFQLCERP